MLLKPSPLALCVFPVNNNVVSAWKGQFGGKCLEIFFITNRNFMLPAINKKKKIGNVKDTA